MKKFLFKIMTFGPFAPALLWAIANVLIDEKLKGVDRLVIIRAVNIVGFLCTVGLTLTTPEPLAGVYNRYDPNSAISMSMQRIIVLVLVAFMYFVADYLYIGMYEDGVPAAHVTMSLVFVPIFVILINVLFFGKAAQPHEKALFILAVLMVIVLFNYKEFDRFFSVKTK